LKYLFELGERRVLVDDEQYHSGSQQRYDPIPIRQSRSHRISCRHQLFTIGLFNDWLMPSTANRQLTLRGSIEAVLGPVLSRQTYANLVYLILAGPLTVLYWSLFSFGMVLGTLLSIVLVGIAILVVMLFVVRALVGVERWLANSLLTVSLKPPDDATTGGGAGGDLRGYIDAASTWQGFGFLFLKMFLGLLGVMLAYGLVQGVTLLSAGVRRPLDVSFGEVNGDPVIWTVETVPETALAMGTGAGIVLLVMHLANGFGYVAERMALALLGDSVEESHIDE
jgi:hypothetical protein